MTYTPPSDTRIPDTLAALAVPIDTLRPYQANPRNGDVDVIAESLRVNGQYRPIVVRQGTGEVLAGNHTLHAAMSLGWSEIAATFVQATDEQAARIVLVDNRANDLAQYDDGLLAQLLGELPDLAGTGYDQAFLDDLLASMEELPPPLEDPDAVPSVPKDPVSVPGDVWILGPHRLVCGDSTDVGALDAVMAGGMADAVWTDPPYGVAYVGSGRAAAEGTERDRIANDNLNVTELEEFLRASLGAALTASRPGACWYVAAPPGPAFLAFATVLTDMQVWRQTLAWVKDVMVIGRSDYHGKHEAILVGHTPGADPLPVPSEQDAAAGYEETTEALLYGWAPGAAHQRPPDRKQTTVWEIPRPKRSPDHPTQKPVALIEKALVNSTNKGMTVLDPFAGSGSTLIACHQQGRVARLVELDARYADVICRRYQQATGTLPILESTGEAHDFEGAS